MKNHHVPMVFPWFSYGFPMVFPWFSHGFPMVFLWFSYDFPMVFLWFSYDFPMVFLCFTMVVQPASPGAISERGAKVQISRGSLGTLALKPGKRTGNDDGKKKTGDFMVISVVNNTG